MVRILFACFVAFAASTAAAQEASPDRMQKLLPQPVAGWTTTGAKAKTVPKGPSKGAFAFQVYQMEARTVIVRITENPPDLLLSILGDPGQFNYEPIEFKGHKAVIKDQKTSGTLLIRLDRFVVSIDWSGAATREDAMRYANAIKIEGVKKLN